MEKKRYQILNADDKIIGLDDGRSSWDQLRRRLSYPKGMLTRRLIVRPEKWSGLLWEIRDIEGVAGYVESSGLDPEPTREHHALAWFRSNQIGYAHSRERDSLYARFESTAKAWARPLGECPGAETGMAWAPAVNDRVRIVTSFREHLIGRLATVTELHENTLSVNIEDHGHRCVTRESIEPVAAEPEADFSRWEKVLAIHKGTSGARRWIRAESGSWLSNGNWAFRCSKSDRELSVKRGFTQLKLKAGFPRISNCKEEDWARVGKIGEWRSRVFKHSRDKHCVEIGGLPFDVDILRAAEIARGAQAVMSARVEIVNQANGGSHGDCMLLSDDDGPWAYLAALRPLPEDRPRTITDIEGDDVPFGGKSRESARPTWLTDEGLMELRRLKGSSEKEPLETVPAFWALNRADFEAGGHGMDKWLVNSTLGRRGCWITPRGSEVLAAIEAEMGIQDDEPEEWECGDGLGAPRGVPVDHMCSHPECKPEPAADPLPITPQEVADIRAGWEAGARKFDTVGPTVITPPVGMTIEKIDGQFTIVPIEGYSQPDSTRDDGHTEGLRLIGNVRKEYLNDPTQFRVLDNGGVVKIFESAGPEPKCDCDDGYEPGLLNEVIPCRKCATR